jgi:preprotein translocase subunit SecG
MLSFLLLVHTLLCLTLIGLVLIQQGKGADMGAAFGGGSNTVFGAGGAADFITKLTTAMAIAFMVSSIFLVKAYSNQAVAVTSSSAVPNPLEGSVMEQAVKPPVDAAAVVVTPESTPKVEGTPATVSSPALPPVIATSAEAKK